MRDWCIMGGMPYLITTSCVNTLQTISIVRSIKNTRGYVNLFKGEIHELVCDRVIRFTLQRAIYATVSKSATDNIIITYCIVSIRYSWQPHSKQSCNPHVKNASSKENNSCAHSEKKQNDDRNKITVISPPKHSLAIWAGSKGFTSASLNKYLQ